MGLPDTIPETTAPHAEGRIIMVMLSSNPPAYPHGLYDCATDPMTPSKSATLKRKRVCPSKKFSLPHFQKSGSADAGDGRKSLSVPNGRADFCRCIMHVLHTLGLFELFR